MASERIEQMGEPGALVCPHTTRPQPRAARAPGGQKRRKGHRAGWVWAPELP